MLLNQVSLLATDIGSVLADSGSSSDDYQWVPLLLLLGGPGFFMLMYTRYRNTDKRHHHETETASEVAHLQSIDRKVDHVTGSSSSDMSGRNERELRG